MSGKTGSGLTVSILAIAQLSAAILGLLFIAIVARNFTLDALGIYLYWQAIATGVEALTDGGLRFTGTARLAGKSATGSQLVSRFLRIKLLLSLVLAGFLTALTATPFLAGAGVSEALLIAMAATTFPSSNPFIWELRATDRQRIEAALLVSYRAMLVVVALFPSIYETPRGLLGVLVVANLVHFCSAMALALGHRKEMRATREQVAGWADLVGEALPFGIAVLAAQLVSRIYLAIVAAHGSEEELAILSLAYSVVLNTTMASVAIGAVYLPKISRVLTTNSGDAKTIAGSVLMLSGGIGAVFAVGGTTMAEALSWIFLGKADTEFTDLLMLFAWVAPFLCTSMSARYLLAAFGRGAVDGICNVAALATAVLLGVFAFSHGGLRGLVVLVLTSEALAAIARIQTLRMWPLRIPIAGNTLVLWIGASVVLSFFVVQLQSEDFLGGAIARTMVGLFSIATATAVIAFTGGRRHLTWLLSR